MAGNSWEKRQREKAKRERKEAKRARRTDKRTAGVEPVEGPTPEELMAEFAELNRNHAAGQVPEEEFLARRRELFIAMGVPVE